MNHRNITIIQMEEKHAQEVLNIYRESIENEDVTLVTEVPCWEEWDERHDKNCRIVAVWKYQVVGFAVISDVYASKVYKGVGEISIYVDAKFRKEGIGYQLLSHLITLGEDFGYHTLQTRIFPGNKASISLHENVGFRFIGYREKITQKNGIWRDVYVFERRSCFI